MSAITGIYHRDGRPASADVLARMVDAVAAWPSDRQSTWYDGPVGMGHRLLFNTPESLHERQPVSDGAGRTLTSAVRLDNRAELMDELGIPASGAAQLTDPDLILAAYAKWGEQCADRLLGDYAFALWDAPARRLFCARSPFGVMPFYYHAGAEVFVWGSSIDAVLAVPGVPRRLNEEKVALALVKEIRDDRLTFYADIERLPGGHCLSVSAEEVRMWRFWELTDVSELRLKSDAEYEEAFEDLFVRAVDARLRSVHPIGAAFSGGLDSSAVCCVAASRLAEAGRDQLIAASAWFPRIAQERPEIDELAYQQSVVDRGGIRHELVDCEQEGPILPFMWKGTEPCPVFNIYLCEHLYRRVAETGGRTVLTGMDGDTVVGHGYSLFQELAARLCWLRLWSECRAYGSRRNVSPHRILWVYALRPWIPDLVKQAVQRHYARTRQLVPLPKGIREDFAERVGLAALQERYGTQEQTDDPRESMRQMLTSGVWNDYGDEEFKVKRRVPVETRHPFFDLRLVQFCLRLPIGQRLRDGLTRSIMRRGLRRYLPDAIAERAGKGDLSGGFEEGLRRQLSTFLTPSVRDRLSAYVPVRFLDEGRDHVLTARRIHPILSQRLFAALVLGMWLEEASL